MKAFSLFLLRTAEGKVSSEHLGHSFHLSNVSWLDAKIEIASSRSAAVARYGDRSSDGDRGGRGVSE